MKPLRLLILLLIAMVALAQVKGGETNYFLVGEIGDGFGRNDSYVLPLSNADDIEYARYLVMRNRLRFIPVVPEDCLIVVACVAAGKDGINRNYLNPKFPEWSWHVTEFLGFAQLTAEVYDGGPTQVETGHYSGWPLLGFWHYTVIRELGPVPLYLSIIPEGPNLQFYWSGVGTNNVYTLESKDSLLSTNWSAVLGAPWPLNTNRWTLPQTNVNASFFRVKAEETKE
jgi:hypothetical protein